MMRLSDAGMLGRQTKLLYPDHRPSPWLNGDATRDRSNRLLAFCMRRQFFAHYLAHLLGCERLLHVSLMCPERIVDQRLISLSRTFRGQPKASEHLVI